MIRSGRRLRIGRPKPDPYTAAPLPHHSGGALCCSAPLALGSSLRRASATIVRPATDNARYRPPSISTTESEPP